MNSTTSDGPLATVDPDVDADVCARPGCSECDGLRAIDPHDRGHERRVLCPVHAFEYMEELR